MTDPADVFRARHDEASRIASALDERGHEAAAEYVRGRADTWQRAQAVIDGIRHSQNGTADAVEPDEIRP